MIEAARRTHGQEREDFLDELFRRTYADVAAWCLRLCGDRDLAADLAQEALARAYTRLDSFRLESRFTTWLYRVTRSVALNRLDAMRRRAAAPLEDEQMMLLKAGGPSVERKAQIAEMGAYLRQAMTEDLKPLEARVLCMHFVLGFTLPQITRDLELENASGAKAFIVSGKRKLKKSMLERLRGTASQATDVIDSDEDLG